MNHQNTPEKQSNLQDVSQDHAAEPPLCSWNGDQPSVSDSTDPENERLETQSAPSSACPPPPAVKRIETALAYLALLLGFFFIRALPIVSNPLGGTLLLCFLFALGGLYLAFSGISLSRRSIALGAVLSVLSVGLVTQGNSALQRLLFAFLLLFFLYWCYSACGLSGRAIFGENLIPHALQAVFVMPFSSMGSYFRSLPIRRAGKQSDTRVWRTLGWILLGLVVAVIPTAIAVSLLSYDESFNDLLSRIFSFSLDGLWDFLRDLLLGLLVAVPLFSSLFTTKYRRLQNGDCENGLRTPNLRILPKPLLCAAVTPLLLVYVLFFISQWSYYVSAFTHTLPPSLPSYAAYARAGFFELCRVSALNALMLLLFHLLMRKDTDSDKEDRTPSRRDPVQVVYSALLSLSTLILIVTALSKMLLYIDSYGLTQKRVYASWLMLLLAAVFLLVLLAQILPRFSLVRAVVLTGLIFLALLMLPNVDAMIASYNVDAYLSGDLTHLDVGAISEYGVSAVPAIDRLCNTLSERQSLSDAERTVLAEANAFLDYVASHLKITPDSPFSLHIPTLLARHILRGRQISV